MRILIRAGMLPTEDFTPIEVITKNSIGSNVGNLVYQYSVCRTLMTRGVELLPTRYRYRFSRKEIDEFNETCGCFVIPLADAFRENFQRELVGLTKLVKKLKIPCYVIGVGVRAPSREKTISYTIDKEIKEFVSAVLDKSAMLGLRGERTGEYLKRLGFMPERDFTVTGCPSMYLRPELSIRRAEVTKNSRVTYNISPGANAEIIGFIRSNAALFSNAVYIPQNLADLLTVRYGIKRETKNASFPCDLSDPVFDNALFPLSVKSWQNILGAADLSFGTRLHGNIMGVLSGIQTVHIPFDARTDEVVRYHGLTHVRPQYLNRYKNIFDLVESLDFDAPKRVHKRNFEHWIDFLNKNNIRHIYLPGEHAVLDEEIEKIAFRPPVKSLNMTSFVRKAIVKFLAPRIKKSVLKK